MRTHSKRILVSSFIIPLWGLAACEEHTPVACTSVFVASTVTLVDQAGAPVTDAVVTSILARTGDTLSPISSSGSPTGTYIIIDDGNRGSLRQTGDNINVRASRDTIGGTTAVYVFDVPGGCHIHKVSGPDTLTLP